MKIKHPTMLKDSLYNLNPSSGANTDYCKGIVVGTVSVLMAEGYTFEQAVKLVCSCIPMPHWKFDSILPPSWVNDFQKAWNGIGETRGSK